MAPVRVASQVEDQNNAPAANDQAGCPAPNFYGSQSQFKDISIEEKAVSTEIISSDPNEVNWDGPDDVQNPLNWPVWRRTVIVATITAIVFTTASASSIVAPTVPEILEEFNYSKDGVAATLVVTIELLGTAIGPLFFAPLSELYGRSITYNCSNLIFCASSIACALVHSMNGLIALRFIQGCSVACAVTNGAGTIADIVPSYRRGAAMSLFTVGLLVGPVAGPIGGSYLAHAAGWRWVFWLLTIMNAPLAIICLVFLRETYAPTVLENRAAYLRKSTGNKNLYVVGRSMLPPSIIFGRAITRPAKMLFLSPLIMGLSLYIAVVYGYIYLMFSTFSFIFEDQYGFNSANVGLTYLGLTVGMLVGLGFASVVSDRIYVQLTKKHRVEKPEYRLELMIYGAIAIPIGLFIYGWTAQYKIHWIVPIMATFFPGFGVILTFIPLQVYMIDAYTKYAASAIAASSVLRAISAAFVPLAGLSLFDKLGLGWGNSLLGFIAIALGGLPLLFIRVGEDWRKRFDVNFD